MKRMRLRFVFFCLLSFVLMTACANTEISDSKAKEEKDKYEQAG